MAKSLNHKQLDTAGLRPNNANMLAQGAKTGKPRKSFANELAQLQQESAADKTDAKMAVQEQQIVDQPKQNTQQQSQGISEADVAKMIESLKAEQAQLKQQLRDQETQYHMERMQSAEMSQQDATETASKFTTSESSIANAGQENHKQITEALQEGNQAEQQQQQQDSANDRKQQLANWEDLAPRIVEDPVNRAVRIDIPGVIDVETLIVRMKRGAVAVQAVGSKDAMQKLMSGQNELVRNLKEHNVSLDSLQAFEGEVLRNPQKAMAMRQAAQKAAAEKAAAAA